jgi:hypothetical protein
MRQERSARIRWQVAANAAPSRGQGDRREVIGRVIGRVYRVAPGRRPGDQQPAVGEERVLDGREVERAAAPGAGQLLHGHR